MCICVGMQLLAVLQENKPDSNPQADTHHRHCFAVEHRVYIHDDVVRDVGQDVDHGDNGHGNSNRQGQIPTMENKISGFQWSKPHIIKYHACLLLEKWAY